MSRVGVVFGPALVDVASRVGTGDHRSRVRGPDESAADRAAALRSMLSDGVDVVLLVDRARPVRADWAASGALYACVSDHINLTGDNPLVGPNAGEWGPRFPDLTDAWDPALRRALRESAVEERVELFEGVVAAVKGAAPSAAELGMYRMIGADMVGDGFVHEAIVARHAGRRVAGLAVLGAGTELPGETPGTVSLVERALAVATAAPAPGRTD